MRDTPVPASSLEPERLRMAAALQKARATLLVKPRPLAADIAQGALLPLLHALGVDIFDLRTLRLEGRVKGTVKGTVESGAAKDAVEGPVEGERVVYRMLLPGDSCRIEVLAADGRMPPLAPAADTAFGDNVDWVLFSNGRQWRAQTADGRVQLEFELLHPGFGNTMAALLEPGNSPEARIGRAAERLHTETGEAVSPFERISLAEVKSHAEQVRHLHGKLETRFGGEAVDVTSRSAFYYVLAALALAHGREDAIPGDDLVRPPDEPPDVSRSRALGRPGWHLLLDLEPSEIEERIRTLLDALGLNDVFTAALRGARYPSRR